MAAATVNPWDEDEARVPSAADFGADEQGKWRLLEETPKPLKDGRYLYKDMLERVFEGVTAASAMTPSLAISVRFAAGAPVVDGFVAPRTKITTADILFVEHGDGDTTVRLLAAHVPPKRVGPRLTMHEGTAPSGTAAWVEADGYRGVRVKTWVAGTLTDLKFTIEIA